MALRARIREAVAGSIESKTELAKVLAAFSAETGIRHVRLTKVQSSAIHVSNVLGIAYKAYAPGDNHRVEIFEMPDGRWAGEGIRLFDANRPDFVPGWRSTNGVSRLVMALRKNDLVILEDSGRERIFKVVSIPATATNKSVWFAPHNESGEYAKRHKDPDDPFRWLFVAYGQLKTRKARKVTVDYLGRVRDPGPPK